MALRSSRKSAGKLLPYIRQNHWMEMLGKNTTLHNSESTTMKFAFHRNEKLQWDLMQISLDSRKLTTETRVMLKNELANNGRCSQTTYNYMCN